MACTVIPQARSVANVFFKVNFPEIIKLMQSYLFMSNYGCWPEDSWSSFALLDVSATTSEFFLDLRPRRPIGFDTFFGSTCNWNFYDALP